MENKNCGQIFCSEFLESIDKHPCFSKKMSKKYARIHLPVAPECNISCKFCNRKYDCLNESRPGVTSKVLSPEEAFNLFLSAKNRIENLSVVGFAGPGDSLATFENIQKTIDLIRNVNSEVLFCLSTNGLLLPNFAQRLINNNIKHLTITINAVEPEYIPKIYKSFNYEGQNYLPETLAEVFINNQLQGLKMASELGIICKVNILCLKNINDSHIENIVKIVKAHGAFMTNITPLIPAQGSDFEKMEIINNQELNKIRKKCSSHLRQMYHCQQCRADSIGLLFEDKHQDFY